MQLSAQLVSSVPLVLLRVLKVINSETIFAPQESSVLPVLMRWRIALLVLILQLQVPLVNLTAFLALKVSSVHLMVSVFYLLPIVMLVISVEEVLKLPLRLPAQLVISANKVLELRSAVRQVITRMKPNRTLAKTAQLAATVMVRIPLPHSNAQEVAIVHLIPNTTTNTHAHLVLTTQIRELQMKLVALNVMMVTIASSTVKLLKKLKSVRVTMPMLTQTMD
mmetsp:Transcript_50620/g.69368  ORF Transcript_50620/g.69368 Transcript_50620/m.69368 type:complete len:222 (+) Transcript_50620:1380-2045(+)